MADTIQNSNMEIDKASAPAAEQEVAPWAAAPAVSKLSPTSAIAGARDFDAPEAAAAVENAAAEKPAANGAPTEAAADNGAPADPADAAAAAAVAVVPSRLCTLCPPGFFCFDNTRTACIGNSSSPAGSSTADACSTDAASRQSIDG